MKLFTKALKVEPQKVEETVRQEPEPQVVEPSPTWRSACDVFSFLFQEGVAKKEHPKVPEPVKDEPTFEAVFKEVEFPVPRARIEGIDLASDVAAEAARRTAEAAEKRREEIQKQAARRIRRSIGPA